MQINVLENITIRVIGKQPSDVIKLLIGKKNVNEFLIAKKLGLTVNQARNLLYKLLDLGVISYIKKKDKRKGWYTYSWSIELRKFYEFLKKEIEKEIANLDKLLKSRETKRFYLCRTCGFEVTEETALLHNFTCPECGSVYELNEDKKIVKEIQTKIKKFRTDLGMIDEDLDLEIKKEEKKRERDEKRKKKKKKELRAEKRAAAAKLKKKEEKKQKATKKKTKKKPVKIKKTVKKALKKKTGKKTSKKKKK